MKFHLPESAALAGLAALVGMTFAVANAAPPVPITMLYYERKPFHFSTAAGVTGLTAVPAEQVFTKAEIPFVWSVVPASRILEILKSNSGPVCTPGWYKNSEREIYARFTLPIYRDKPVVALANREFKVKEGVTAKELFASRDLKLLVKQNFLFGAYLDEIIKRIPSSQIIPTSAEVPVIVKMIHAKRADMFIITQEEVEMYVNQAELGMSDFQVLKFPDVPGVEMRYVLCSLAVPKETIDALNKAIASTIKLNH